MDVNDCQGPAARRPDRALLAEAGKRLGRCRETCDAYRLEVSRNALAKARERLAELDRELAQARESVSALGAAVGEEGALAAFSRSDPRAVALLAEARLETLSEAVDRLRWRSFSRSWRLPLVCLALAALVAASAAGLSAYGEFKRRQAAVDVFAEKNQTEFHTKGINTVTEQDGPKRWRWAYGPGTELWFKAEGGLVCDVVVSLYNLAEGQSLTITVNDGPGESFEIPLTGFERTGGVLRLPFLTKPGQNIIRIEYRTWNHKDQAFAPGDARPLAVAYETLRVDPRR